MDKQNHLRGSDLFTEEEAREIAAAAAAKKQADPSALQRAIGRIQSVQGAKTGRSGWDKLFERYPDLRPDTLPAEVFELVRGGMTPLEAWQQVLIARMQAESAALRSRGQAVGSMAGDGGPGETDPFLAGLK